MDWFGWTLAVFGGWAVYEFLRLVVVTLAEESKNKRTQAEDRQRQIVDSIYSLKRSKQSLFDKHATLLEEISWCRREINKLKKNGKKEPTKGKAR